MSTDDVYLGNVAKSGIQNLNDIITNNKTLVNLTNAELNNKTNELLEKQEIQINQLKEIEDKEKLLLTRARMLQIAQDRNSYKKKIIYTFIAAIFGIFIVTLVIYVLYVRKISISKNKF